MPSPDSCSQHNRWRKSTAWTTAKLENKPSIEYTMANTKLGGPTPPSSSARLLDCWNEFTIITNTPIICTHPTKCSRNAGAKFSRRYLPVIIFFSSSSSATRPHIWQQKVRIATESTVSHDRMFSVKLMARIMTVAEKEYSTNLVLLTPA